MDVVYLGIGPETPRNFWVREATRSRTKKNRKKTSGHEACLVFQPSGRATWIDVREYEKYPEGGAFAWKWEDCPADMESRYSVVLAKLFLERGLRAGLDKSIKIEKGLDIPIGEGRDEGYRFEAITLEIEESERVISHNVIVGGINYCVYYPESFSLFVDKKKRLKVGDLRFESEQEPARRMNAKLHAAYIGFRRYLEEASLDVLDELGASLASSPEAISNYTFDAMSEFDEAIEKLRYIFYQRKVTPLERPVIDEEEAKSFYKFLMNFLNKIRDKAEDMILEEFIRYISQRTIGLIELLILYLIWLSIMQ